MSTWTASLFTWLPLSPVTSLTSGKVAAELTIRLLADEMIYYRSQSPVGTTGFSALMLAILFSILLLANVIWRVAKNCQSSTPRELFRLMVAQAVILILAVALALASTFWDGQPTHGRVEGY
ncbi:MAG: hypothetical protein V4662_15860 [Verrucomicrobiota bacterium]